jgi:ATP-binding cassette subfamily B protein
MADLIVVLEKGQIAARGTHDQLLRTSELYAKIYHGQLRPQEQHAEDGQPVEHVQQALLSA